MTETIESLDKRIRNIESKLEIVVESIAMISDQFTEMRDYSKALNDAMEFRTEDIESNTEYLRDVGDGEPW